jgi:hypothetical protein
MIYLLTEIGSTPGGSSTVHIYTQTIHRTIQITYKTQITTEQQENNKINDKKNTINKNNTINNRTTQLSTEQHN